MALYEFVARSDGAVGRDEPRGPGNSPPNRGLPPRPVGGGRTGRGRLRAKDRSDRAGAGRPAKLYRRSEHELEVTVAAPSLSAGSPAPARGDRRSEGTLEDSAHRLGVSMGGPGLTSALEEAGYLPFASDDEIRFATVPSTRWRK